MKKLKEAIHRLDSVVCVGIDPVIEHFPPSLRDAPISLESKLTQFGYAVLEGAHDLAPVVKPQLAFFEKYGLEGIKAYINILHYARSLQYFVLTDAKRGDIGSTASAYAEAFLKPDADFASDALTINPYLGDDNQKAFYALCKEYDKSVFVLVKTSNPTSGQLQNLMIEDKPLYLYVADLVLAAHEPFVGAVVGATHPHELLELRDYMPETMFLIPGYGAQGGSADGLKGAFGKNKDLAIVNSSRGIIYAHEYYGLSTRDSVHKACLDMKEQLNRVRYAE